MYVEEVIWIQVPDMITTLPFTREMPWSNQDFVPPY